MGDRLTPGMIEQFKQLHVSHFWIDKVLDANIYKSRIPQNPLVLHLNVGDCDELLHTKFMFHKQNPRLVAVDLEEPRQPPNWKITPRDIVMYTGTQFEVADIRDVDLIMSMCGRVPDVVISRHPRVLDQAVDDPSYKVFNEWWGDTLAEYGRLVSAKRGQMLVTTMHIEERDLIARAFQNYNVPVSIRQNNFAPKELNFRISNGPLVVPDGYTLKVG